MGWKVKVTDPKRLSPSVMVAAPHTSNWDFPIALSCFWYMGVDVRYFIKSEYTRGVFGWLFKWTGALGVDRSNKGNKLVDHAIDLLRKKDMVILVPAEGSRKAVEKWRTGFYHIALGAEVPVSLGYLDYKEKEGGVLDLFQLSGDFEKDMQHIQQLYKPITGKFPENYNPDIF